MGGARAVFAKNARQGLMSMAAALTLTTPALAGPQDTEAAMTETIGEAMLTEGTGTQEGLTQWLSTFKDRALAAGISSATLDALKGAEYLPKVVRNDRHQNEFTKTIWEYLDTAVSQDRIAHGLKALKSHGETLARIEATYGVNAEVVAAIWGLESAYGAVRGDIPTLHALATLAYDGRRGAFFESQLIAALKIIANGDVSARGMTGSWAGAMGHTQFIPTSYLAYAVDFTGDGKRDIWSEDPTDSLASTAAYLKNSGWQRGLPWGGEVRLPSDFNPALLGRGKGKSAGEWAALGVTSATGGAVPASGSIIAPKGIGGPAFLLTQNFNVILRYNNAESYAIGVGHLSDRLLGRPAVQADWGPDQTGMTMADRHALQRALTDAGYDTGGTDGVIGTKTKTAISAYQQASGLPVTGEPSLDLLRRFR